MTGHVTSNLSFRTLDDTHISALFEMDNDPEVMRYINNCPVVPWENYPAKTRAWFERLAKNDPGLTFWAAHERATDEFIG